MARLLDTGRLDMKKTNKKLALNPITVVKLLQESELTQVNGAATNTCNTSCNFPPSCACPTKVDI